MTEIEQLVARLHSGDGRWVIATTGGGTSAIADLLRWPGGSKTVLECLVPYSEAALTALLGARPDQFCSATTARSIAMAAFERARRLAFDRNKTSHIDVASNRRLVGVGCTASLASSQPKRGAHRFFIAVQSSQATQTWSVELQKGLRSRPDEEAIVGCSLLNALADWLMVETMNSGLNMNEKVTSHTQVAEQGWEDLLLGRIRAVEHTAHGATRCVPMDAEVAPKLLFPGAFHPLHDGHRTMADIASRRLGQSVAFEISIRNVDKPTLDFVEMYERWTPFRGDADLWFTSAPTFVEKARLFPRSTFIVGADTIRRISNPKYYHESIELRDRAIEQLNETGSQFLVFGRVDRAAGFQTLTDLDVPLVLRRLCEEVPEEAFRLDISSTAIRAANELEN